MSPVHTEKHGNEFGRNLQETVVNEKIVHLCLSLAIVFVRFLEEAVADYLDDGVW